ncbi:MAG: class I SAM-dependent methyltransferase [Anaerolineae bacterium]
MPTDTARQTTIEILDELFGRGMQGMGVRLWDGALWPDTQSRRVTLVLEHAGALRAMLLPASEVGLGEAYVYGDIDIEGEIEAVFSAIEKLLCKPPRGSAKLRLGRKLLTLPEPPRRERARRGPAKLSGRTHSLRRDRQAISYHYDVSNDFYALWQDSHMVYSCAYFCDEGDDLETAQCNKLDYICRKLRLRPGARLLDIGCGWGGLVRYAATHYGADVTGITLSEPQAALSNVRIAEEGLSDHCRVLFQDYRQLDGEDAYDALVSVGMFEHVGQAQLPNYFQQAWRLLRPGGVFLNHGIASRATDPVAKGRTFFNTYVFPDGELVPVSTTLRVAEEGGFEVRDVECLREHYALTLRQWVKRLEERHDQALQYVDEATYRVWRLYMSGSAHGFATGRNNVYQTLLVKPGSRGESGLPLTREDWYRKT